MKIEKMALAIAGMLMLVSLPAYSSTMIDFGTSSASGAVTISGTNISSTTFIAFGEFSVATGSGTTYYPSSLGSVTDLLEMTFNSSGSGSLAITNNASSGSSSSNTLPGGGLSLFSAVTNLHFTNASSGGILSENFSALVTGNATFLGDIGLPAGTEFVMSGGINGTYSGSSGTVTSDSIVFTAVPEPASMFLLGAGLLALLAIARKQRRPATIVGTN